MQGYTVRYLYKGGHADAKVYLADQVNDRETQHIAIDRAQKAKIEKLEEKMRAAFAACEVALSEAEAILGGEYDVHHGSLFERIEKARSLMER